MKKDYLAPSAQLISMQVDAILATSLEVNNSPQNNITGDTQRLGSFHEQWSDASWEDEDLE